MTNIEYAEKVVAAELRVYAATIKEEYREDFFDGRNRDDWVRGFCEWFADKQRKSAEIRASND
jgi:hypothetical protein